MAPPTHPRALIAAWRRAEGESILRAVSRVDPEDLPAPGTLLAGKYEVVGMLGKGAMGAVLEAKHTRLGKNVALKLLLPHLRRQSDISSRFEREARAASRITSENVARVIDVDTLPDGSPFMVMELLRGCDLSDALARQGKLGVAEAVGYMLQACAAMDEAHRLGIVHRDLKPANLFLANGRGQPTLKVLDFGISKVSDEGSATATTTQSAFGTPVYMSPEQVRSTKNVDARADIWSLGVILYELLAGRPPFDAPTPTGTLAAIIADTPTPVGQLRPDLPPKLAAAVMKALVKDPAGRYPDVRAFAAAIAPFGPRGHASALGLAPASLRPRGGGSARAAIVVGVVVVGVVGIAALVAAARRGEGAGSAATAASVEVVADTAVIPATATPAAAPPTPEVTPASASPSVSPPAASATGRAVRPPPQPPRSTAQPTAPARPPTPPGPADPKYL